MDWKIISDQQIVATTNYSKLEETIQAHSIRKELLHPDHPYAENLAFFLILTYYSNDFLIAGFSELDIAMNRFSRLKHFYEIYSETEGFDAGMEDQLYNLMIDIHEKFPDLNWNAVMTDYFSAKQSFK